MGKMGKNLFSGSKSGDLIGTVRCEDASRERGGLREGGVGGQRTRHPQQSGLHRRRRPTIINAEAEPVRRRVPLAGCDQRDPVGF